MLIFEFTLASGPLSGRCIYAFIKTNINNTTNRGVYSSRKSNYSPALCVVYKILPQILPQLQKLQVHFNQRCRSVFDLGGEWFCVVHRGCLRGDVPPSEAGKFCIFETGIVQFDEYFWEQIYSMWWWVKNQFYRPDWPKFCIFIWE